MTSTTADSVHLSVPSPPNTNIHQGKGTPRPSIDDGDDYYYNEKCDELLTIHRKHADNTTEAAAYTISILNSTAPIESDSSSSSSGPVLVNQNTSSSSDNNSCTSPIPGTNGIVKSNSATTTRESDCCVDNIDNSNIPINHDGNHHVNHYGHDDNLSSSLMLVQPPNHFLCRIQNTLLQDPVIDREGHTYERDAILRWLVLTSSNFDGGGDAKKDSEETSVGSIDDRVVNNNNGNVGRGTSPITGNPMSVEELVEDHVVKSAIERWRKDSRLRFNLLGNKDDCDTDVEVQAMVEEFSDDQGSNQGAVIFEGVDASDRIGSSNASFERLKQNYGTNETSHDNRRMLSNWSSATSHTSNKSNTSSHSSSKSQGSSRRKSKKNEEGDGKSKLKDGRKHHRHRHGHNHRDNHHQTQDDNHMEHKKGYAVKMALSPPPQAQGAPRMASPLPSDESRNSIHNQHRINMVVSKHYPPPPPRQQSSKRRDSENSNITPSNSNSRNSSSHNNGSHRERLGDSAKGSSTRSSLTSSQKSQRTTVTSNVTAISSRPSPATNDTLATGVLPSPPPVVSTRMPPSQLAPGPQVITACQDEFSSQPSLPPPVPIAIINTSSNSFSSNNSNPHDAFSSYTTTASAKPVRLQHNGWSVPLGVHKVISSAPGLRVTTQVHRRSIPVQVPHRAEVSGKAVRRDSGGSCKAEKELIIPPGSYVDILETQVHGERVRGRICWEVEEEDSDIGKHKKRSIKGRTSKLLKRTSLRKQRDGAAELPVKVVEYEGWISLQWAKNEEGNDAEKNRNIDVYRESGHAMAMGRNGSGRSVGMEGRVTDEDSGPWTETIPLGVYRISFIGGLPLRETPDRDSALIDKLDRGRCVEVVQTQIKGDRVRARVIVPDISQDEDLDSNGDVQIKYTSGWISLLNALTGASGASPVPLGAYVVVAEQGCVITEGGRLKSKVKGSFVPGSCIQVVATRMEEGIVRGLIASGGHVTLFVPPGAKQGSSATTRASGGRSKENKPDGGRMLAMPVPLGTYQIIRGGLSVTSCIASTSSILMKLPLDATVEITETCVDNGRVRGRVCAAMNKDGSRPNCSGSNGTATGWINLFDPNQRWAKIVCFKGWRPVGVGPQRQRRSHSAT